MSPHESSLRKNSRRSKPGGDAGGDASLFTVAATTIARQETTEVEAENEDITRPVRRCVSNPSRPQLTEESLLQLEQSLPGYRLAHRNLHHWFFYIQSTILDSFDTYRDIPDPDFYPNCFNSPVSETPLSEADFQESHHSPAGSTDLFGNTVRLAQEIQVVIPSRASSGLPYPWSASSNSIESNPGSSSSGSVVSLPEPVLPASTLVALAEIPLQSPELLQPVESRQSHSHTRRRISSSSESSFHPYEASPPRTSAPPLALRRRITRSRSQHVSRAAIDPSKVITLSDS
jgi:hypothetical protein